MARSYIIKDDGGHAVGYVQQVGEKIRGKINPSAHLAGKKLRFSFENGRSKEEMIPEDGGEREWQGSESKLIGASIVSSAQAYGGKKQMTERAHPGNQARKNQTEAEQAAKRHAEQEHTAHVFPDRRWPPPCCLQAVYRQGKWISDA